TLERLGGLRLAEVDELEVAVEKLVAGGDGLARFAGVPIFVRRAAPGDRLRVRLVERRPDYGRAEIVEVLVPGPDRRPDPVPSLAEWGGCDLMHIADAAQARHKAAAARETLERLGGLRLAEAPALVTGDPWHYRLRTQLHTEPVRSEPGGGGVLVGYHARGSHRLVPVVECPILLPELERFVLGLSGELSAGAPRRLDVACGDGGAITVAPVVPGLPHGEVAVEAAGSTYTYDARCFFQAHRGLLPRLIEAAVGPWEGGEAFDLYCGVGLFTLPLARRYGRVVGLEGDRVAARYARNNTRRNRLPNAEIESSGVEGWIEALPESPDRVLVDPPRTGLPPPVRRALLERRAGRLTYVSCDPATLARDLAVLRRAYAVESVTLLDLFPQTGHIETVVQMVRA
ncbi:MAG TPA: TRAM domain-containing protein, partial [Thermoanaerobaculia bacterium]|nr:TRAM domain-containing protein [Thermoanaerobaculia bacterium]